MSGTKTSGSNSGSGYTVAQNMSDRMTLLRSGVPMTANLGTFGPFQPGTNNQIKLRNVGVITRLRVRITASITITTAMTASPLGAPALLNRVTTQDYNSTARFQTLGPLLKLLNDTRLNNPYGATGQGLVDTAQYELPTETGANQPIQFEFEVPVARDRMNDLTGAILAQTVVGEQYLILNFNGNLVGDVFSPYTAGAGTLTNIYAEVLQDYIQPQPNSQGQIALPLIDLNTVYEFNALYKSPEAITGGGQKFIDYPNVRNVLSMVFGFVNDGALTVNGTDITALTLIANGNTDMREEDPLFNRMEIRNRLGGDWPPGFYWNNHRSNPIQTNIYSQVQERLDFAAGVSGASSYVAYGFESTYMLNTPLPGIASGS
jgi:hypothetical protein